MLNRMLVFIPLAICILFELKTFEIWSQILYLWDVQASPVEQLLIFSPHSFRYALMYPVMSISENFGIDKDFSFSFIVLLLGFSSALLIFNSLKRLQNEKMRGNTASLFISVLIVLLLFFMNGRGALALFGFAFLVNVIVTSETGKAFSIGMSANIFLALLFSSVSSGTLTVSFATLSLYLLKQLQHILWKLLQRRFAVKHFKIFLVGLVVCSIFSSMIIVGFIKNLSFYGIGYEGFVNMLGHGMGIVLKPMLNAISLPLLIAIAIAIAIIMNSIVKKFRYPIIARILVICIACGFFGYTTLSMAIVPLLITLGSMLPDFSVSKGTFRKLQNRRAVMTPGSVE